MIIVNLKGGIGNQMFQYAFAYCVAKINRTDLSFDLRYLQERSAKKGYVERKFYLNLFGIKPVSSSAWDLMRVGMLLGGYKFRYFVGRILDFLGVLVFFERNKAFDRRIYLNRAKNIYIDGYWQSEKYFLGFDDDIREIFKFDQGKFNERVGELSRRIKQSQYPVCMHVRRGDFVGTKEHDIVSADYYLRALKLLRDKVSDDLDIFIFSDDAEWCRNNFLNISKNVSILSNDLPEESFFSDLYLMTMFSLFVIPNSTFAWWGAWLAPESKKIVVAPKVWSGVNGVKEVDILPESWIRIEN
jgi:hypothetical protein